MKKHHKQNLVNPETSKNSTNKCKSKVLSPSQDLDGSAKKPRETSLLLRPCNIYQAEMFTSSHANMLLLGHD